MTVITFTPEKQGLINDWLKANCGGRKWHEVKAKKQDQAEAYANKIIADSAAKNAEREAAEALRQERLAMPSERHYDGVDLTHVPVVKTESSVPAYKSIFNINGDDLDLSSTIFWYIFGLSATGAKSAFKHLGINDPSIEYMKKVDNLLKTECLRILFLKSNKNTIDYDNEMCKKLYLAYTHHEYAMINWEKFDTAEKAFAANLHKRGLFPMDNFKGVILWMLNHPIKGTDDRDTIGEKIERFMESCGDAYMQCRVQKVPKLFDKSVDDLRDHFKIIGPDGLTNAKSAV